MNTPTAIDATLRQIERRETLAQRWQQARSVVARQAYAEAYHAIVGVHPAQRNAFRRSLESLHDAGNSSLDSLIARFRHDIHVNGLSSSEEAGN